MTLKNISRAIGALLGIALAGSLVAIARPSSEVPTIPATVSFEVPLSGELEVDPVAPRPVLDSASLQPESPRGSTSFDVRNQTADRLSVGFKAESAGTSLDSLLRIRLSFGGAVIADTTLQGLRAGSESTVSLDSGQSAAIRLEAWIPPSVETGYESQRANISLVPELSREQG
jgi:hypothetical protein